MHYSLILSRREFPTHPSGGLIPPNFRTTPPASGGKGEREKGEGGEREGKRRREEKGPQGLVDTPHVPNPEKYPAQILKNALL